MSRGFVSSLAGIAMTLLAWFGPWTWPGWPAFAVIEVAFGSQAAFADLPPLTRAAMVVVLIVINAGCWAAVAALVMRLAKLRAR